MENLRGVRMYIRTCRAVSSQLIKQAQALSDEDDKHSVFHVFLLQEKGCSELVFRLIMSPKASM